MMHADKMRQGGSGLRMYEMLSRLVNNWVYGGSMAGVMLLVLLPTFWSGWNTLEVLTFLHLPAYMLHQWEEHDADRFRLFINAEIGKGLEVLSPLAVFIINVPGVWGVITLSILLTVFVHPGFALISAWLVLINGVAHLAQGIAMQRYNPGLVTSALFFVPLGLVTLWTSRAAPAGSLVFQLMGLGTSLAIHAAIIAHVIREKKRLSIART